MEILQPIFLFRPRTVGHLNGTIVSLIKRVFALVTLNYFPLKFIGLPEMHSVNYTSEVLSPGRISVSVKVYVKIVPLSFLKYRYQNHYNVLQLSSN